jgi:hypothetical protein
MVARIARPVWGRWFPWATRVVMTNGNTNALTELQVIGAEALAALDTGRQISPFSARLSAFDLDDDMSRRAACTVLIGPRHSIAAHAEDWSRTLSTFEIDLKREGNGASIMVTLRICWVDLCRHCVISSLFSRAIRSIRLSQLVKSSRPER